MTTMRGDTTAAERHEQRMSRLSARQRVVVLTFETVEQAEAWEANGCPLAALEVDG